MVSLIKGLIEKKDFYKKEKKDPIKIGPYT